MNLNKLNIFIFFIKICQEIMLSLIYLTLTEITTTLQAKWFN